MTHMLYTMAMTIISEDKAAEYYNSQPKKRVTAGVLIFNTNGEVLVVKPNYLDRWLFPGGGVDLNESPLTAAKRECQEELGVVFETLRPAFINYISPHANGNQDIMQCLFTVDLVDDNFMNTVTLQTSELDDAKFVTIESLIDYVGDLRAIPVETFVKHAGKNVTLYLENGRLAA